MPIAVRRFLYSLLALLGFVMMMPAAVNMRRVQAELGVDPMAMDLETSAWISRLGLLFLAGLSLAAGFLYVALSTGHRKSWRPVENGQPRCARCGAEVSFGIGRCPACDQQLVW